MNNNDYIIKLLNFQDKYIEITKIEYKNNIYYIYIDQIKNVDCTCPKCGGAELTINSRYKRKIKYQNINSSPSFIYFNQIRYICKYCNKTFNQPTSIVEKNNIISNNSKNLILKEAHYKQSFKDISKRTNLSQTTISNEFKKNIHDFRCHLTRIVCIDEFKANTIAGKYALIVGDPESGEILDILESRLQDYIYHYFNTMDKEEIKKVEYIVTDLSESYRTICRNIFYDSIHIADRFHWIKLSTEAFNKTRIAIMNHIIKHKSKDKELITYANVLKKYYKLLLANKYAKEAWYFDQPVYANRHGFTTFQTVIEYCVNKDREFEEAYLLLQELYKIAKYSTFETARQDILNWCDKIENSEFNLPEFKRVALTYRSWIKEIVNSFILDPITHKRLSNGFIEGKNNFCKVIKRIGFGQHDFDTFRYKIIITNRK